MQQDLSALTQIDRTYLSGLERARRNPSLSLISLVADALGTTPAVLLSEQAGRAKPADVIARLLASP